MARETQKEKIARLEAELAQAITTRDAAIADALATNSKLNAKYDVSDSPMYQSLLRDLKQWKLVAKDRQDQIEEERQRHGKLITLYEDLEQQLKESQALLAKLQADREAALKARKNPFGAGRKLAYTDHAEKIKQLHEEGMSVRKIAESLKIPSATVARYLKTVSK